MSRSPHFLRNAFVLLATVLLVACSGSSNDSTDSSPPQGQPDVIPNMFSFNDMDDVPIGEWIVSESIEVGGFDTALFITIQSGEYSIDGGPFTSQPREIVAGQSVVVRGLSAGTYATTVEVIVDIGGVSGTFTISTHAAPVQNQIEINVTVEPVENNNNNGNDQSSQFNWVFRGEDLVSGQFANGDYWVASSSRGAVEFVSLTSNQIVRVDDRRFLNSLGFFKSSYGNYDQAKDLLIDLGANPRVYSENTVLVAATQRNQAETSNCGTSGLVENGCIDAYHFVTILQEVPPNNGSEHLRPPLVGSDRSIQSLTDFDFNRLPNLNYLPASSLAEIDRAQRMFTHGTHIFSVAQSSNTDTYSEGGRAFRCGHILCDDYSAGFSQSYYNALSYVFSENNTFESKKALLASLLTLGRDMYAMMHQGGCSEQGGSHPESCRYSSGAGQHLGNFIAAAFYASLETDQTKSETLRAVSGLLDGSQCNIGPHELDQINGHLDEPLWGDCERFSALHTNVAGYWADMIEASCYDDAPGACNLVVGQRASRDLYQQVDGSQPRPGGSYMNIVLGQQRSMVAAACVLPELAHVINFPPLYEYVDRVNTSGIRVTPDNCAVPQGVVDSQACSNEIWAKRNTPTSTWADVSPNCPGFGISWGADPSDISQCIAGAGRFNQVSNDITPSFTSRLDSYFELMRGPIGTDCGAL